jgi:hypothetical protein
MFEEIQFMIDQCAIELAHAIRMAKEIGSRVGEIIAGAIGDVVRDFDLFHLIAIDGVGAEIARNRGHVRFTPLASGGTPVEVPPSRKLVTRG